MSGVNQIAELNNGLIIYKERISEENIFAENIPWQLSKFKVFNDKLPRRRLIGAVFVCLGIIAIPIADCRHYFGRGVASHNCLISVCHFSRHHAPRANAGHSAHDPLVIPAHPTFPSFRMFISIHRYGCPIYSIRHIEFLIRLKTSFFFSIQGFFLFFLVLRKRENRSIKFD